MMDRKINFSTNFSVFSNIFHCLFGTVKFVNNIDLDKYEGSGYGIGFYSRSNFSLSNGEFSKNVIIMLGVVNSSSVHVDNRQKNLGFW